MTVHDLRAIVIRRAKTHTGISFRPWVNSGPIRALRLITDLVLHQPIFNHFVSLTVRGVENIPKNTPVLFAPNHTSYFDVAAILYALPRSMRYHVASAAGDEFFFNRGGMLTNMLFGILYEYVSTLFNAFLLPKKAGFKQTLSYMGKLVDKNVSIIYFPEGKLMQNGVASPLKQGIGIIAKELGIPIVPVKFRGLDAIIGAGIPWPKKGSAEVIFGQPLSFAKESPNEIVQILKNTLDAM